MNNQKILSVCIPTYEMHGFGKEFLKYSFDILTAQTFKDFDVVISDFSKNKEIKNLCDEYSHQLTINYYRNESKEVGMAININNVLSLATGKIIKLLLQDDFLYHEDSLKDIVDNFDLEKDKWMATACIHTKDTKKYFRPFYPRYNPKIHMGQNTISSPSVLVLLNQDLLMFDTNLKWYVDVDYYKRCFDKFGLPKILNKINVVNRIGSHQTTNREITNEIRRDEFEYIVKKFNEKTKKDVTLVAVSVIDPESAAKSLEYSMYAMDYGEIVLISDRKPKNLHPKITFKKNKPGQLQSKDPKNKNDYSKFIAYDLHEYIDTKFALIVHNDAYVIRPHKWDYQYLEYDYIGAPWRKDEHFTNEGVNVRVGNGGFSLRSRKMMTILNELNLPFTDNGTGYYNEDGLICVYHRKVLEDNGIKFAPVPIASKFSHELDCEDSDPEPFGFHNNKKIIPRFFFLKFQIKKLLGKI